MFLSVIIPAYNEEKRLPATLKKVRDYLNRQVYDWEVLVVNDGSKDKTAEVIKHTLGSSPFASGHPIHPTQSLPDRPRSLVSGESEHDFDRPRSGDIPSGSFRLIDNQVNQGKGCVVKQGMLAAKGDWRLFMDADNSTDIEEIEKLWDYAKNGLGASFAFSRPSQPTRPLPYHPRSLVSGESERDLDRHFAQDAPSASKYDVIIGSRYLNKDSIKIKQPFIRRIVSRMGNILIRILLGVNMVDTQCGFKLFSAKAAEEIFPKQTIERWGFDMEILAIAKKKGYKIKEVAVDWYDAEGSQVKKSAALQTLKELLVIKWNLIRGKYSH